MSKEKTTVVKLNSDNENYSSEELASILSDLNHKATSGTKTALFTYFGLRFAQFIDKPTKILELAGMPTHTHANSISIGKQLYNLISDGFLGFTLNNSAEGKELPKVYGKLEETLPRQIIFYGAPGTGKSHTTDGIIADFPDSHQRTTFHPDTDYSSFVGCYKPTKENDGKLTYKFVPQVFLKAYVEAWRNPALPYFLVIEEINRGNCAQIFGDIFQLLDRDKANGGISKYTITPDEDIRKYLGEVFADDDFEHLPDLLRLGERMQLPGNLYILATMNTSDQSLFPIDSAFKRRWAWKYRPIEQGRDKEGKPYEWQICNGNYAYDWWEFISKINEKIEDATQSEDKKMGFWFTSPENGVGYITQEDFISKVLFYLWNDIYKDFAKTDETIFKGQPVKAEGESEEPKAYEIFFTHFFRTDGSVENRVRDFMRFNGITENVFVDPTPKDDDSESEGEDEDDSPSPDNKAHWEDFVKALAGTSIADKVNISKLAIPEVRIFELKCSDLPDCKVGASIATKKGRLRVYFWSGGNNQDIIRPIIEGDKDSILQQLSEATNGNVKICGKKVLTIEATDDTMSTEWQANAFAAFYDFFTDLLSDFQAGDTGNDEIESNNRVKYSINGNGSYSARRAYLEAFKQFVSQHADYDAKTVLDEWRKIGNSMQKKARYFILSQEEYDGLTNFTSKNARFEKFTMAEDNLYLTNQWTKEAFDSFLDAIASVEPDLHIVETK